MPKKLAIFCDGTWNELRMPVPTNVSRLAKCVKTVSDAGVPQIVFYDEGVGVGSGIKLVDSGVRWLGGALGKGLEAKIEPAYRFIVLNYDPGDDIYLFGFSRGAYTARSICGLIRKCGILRQDSVNRVPDAMDLYRSPDHPNHPTVVEFRKTFAHALAAGVEDYDRLGIEAHERRHSPETLEHLYQYRPERSYRMMYLGLWDTVGSLGVPDRFGFLKWANRKHQFHDTRASVLLSSIRHAVAIDENRRVFSSTPVENVADLNRVWAARTGWDVTNGDDPQFVPFDWRPYQERWFPGDHGAVGGGNPQLGLSSIALEWIAQGAQNAGLDLYWTPGLDLSNAQEWANPCANWHVRKDGTFKNPRETDFLGRVGGYRKRKGPGHVDEVSDCAYERWCRDEGYRPRNLTVMRGRSCVFYRGRAGRPPARDRPAGFPGG